LDGEKFIFNVIHVEDSMRMHGIRFEICFTAPVVLLEPPSGLSSRLMRESKGCKSFKRK
jgi:hypothetical protein